MEKKNFWERTPVLVLMALIATFLWGSAFPSIKIGYQLFGIAGSDTAGQILFAGTRFAIAGIMVIAVTSLQQHRFAAPKRSSWLYVLALACFQTIGQYFFFYVGLAHASGVSSSLIEATATFLTILFAVFFFHTETLTAAKVIGCIVGFAGVALIEMPLPGQAEGAFGFSLFGEGFVLISTIAGALAACFIKVFSKNEDPAVLSGWQFFFGGIVLALCGYAGGGRLHAAPAQGASSVTAVRMGLGVLLLLYMAFISACAYTLWSMLLKYNPVSRVAVFGFINPVVGVILSALLLDEKNQAFSLIGLASLALVSAGIIIVNRTEGRLSGQDAAKD